MLCHIKSRTGYSFLEELNQQILFRRLLDVLLCAAHLSFISPGFTVSCSSSDWLSSVSPAAKRLRILAVSANKSWMSISVVLAVMPLRYQEMGGGGTIAGCISWSSVTFEPTLPLPPVHWSYSSSVFGFRRSHICSSTNKGFTFQFPSNLFMNPLFTCLNLICRKKNHFFFTNHLRKKS